MECALLRAEEAEKYMLLSLTSLEKWGIQIPAGECEFKAIAQGLIARLETGVLPEGQRNWGRFSGKVHFWLVLID